MKQLSNFINSITKIESYEYFLKQPFGKALIYLLLLTIVFSGIASIKDAILLSTGIDEFITEFATNVPYFEVNNGELSIDKEMPLVIEDTADNLFVIDTSGELDESILNDREHGLFVSRFGYTYKSGTQTQTLQFSDIPELKITKNDLQSWLPYLRWITLIIIVFGFIFFFIGKLFAAFIISILGLILQAMANYRIGFSNLYKLSIYALTLSIVIQFFVRLSTLHVPHFWIIYYGLPLVYLWKVLEYLRKKELTGKATETLVIE